MLDEIKEYRKATEPESKKIEITAEFADLLHTSEVSQENKVDKIQHFLTIGRKFAQRSSNKAPKIVPRLNVNSTNNNMKLE